MSVSAQDWSKSDKQLAADPEFPALLKKYGSPAAKDAVERTKKALEAKKHVVKVVADEKEAVEYLASLIPDGTSVSMGHSTTLQQIGFIDHLKARDAKITNYKAKSIEAASKGDMAGQAKFIAQGNIADVYLSSVSAVSEEGDFFCADLTGTRFGGWLTAGKLVVVTGSNKIVKDEAEAEHRLVHYQLALESARVRVAYGVPASQISNKIAVRAANPWNPRVTVVIIEKSLGF